MCWMVDRYKNEVEGVKAIVQNGKPFFFMTQSIYHL